MGDSPLLAFVKSRHLLIAIAMKDDIEVKLKKKNHSNKKEGQTVRCNKKTQGHT